MQGSKLAFPLETKSIAPASQPIMPPAPTALNDPDSLARLTEYYLLDEKVTKTPDQVVILQPIVFTQETPAQQAAQLTSALQDAKERAPSGESYIVVLLIQQQQTWSALLLKVDSQHPLLNGFYLNPLQPTLPVAWQATLQKFSSKSLNVQTLPKAIDSLTAQDSTVWLLSHLPLVVKTTGKLMVMPIKDVAKEQQRYQNLLAEKAPLVPLSSLPAKLMKQLVAYQRGKQEKKPGQDTIQRHKKLKKQQDQFIAIAKSADDKGEYAEAASNYRQAFAIQIRLLGNDDPRVARMLTNMANMYAKGGRYAEGLAQYEKALAIQRQTLGSSHLDVATTLMNIGNIYILQGRYAEGLAQCKGALAIQRQAPSVDQRAVAKTLMSIANVYAQEAQYTESLVWYEEVLAIQMQTSDVDQQTIAMTLMNMANVYHAQDRYAEALVQYEKALVMQTKTLNADHPAIAATLMGMANVYNRQGRYAEALVQYEKALVIKIKTPGGDHPETASVRVNMATVYHAQGRYAEALVEYRKALTIQTQKLNADHPEIAATLMNIGNVYYQQGHYTEALVEYRKALTIKTKTLGAGHPETASALVNIANVHNLQGHYTKALDRYEEASAIYKNRLGVLYFQYCETLERIAQLHETEAFKQLPTDAKAATSLLEKSFNTLNDLHKQHRPLFADAKQTIASVYDLADYDKLLKDLARVARRLNRPEFVFNLYLEEAQRWQRQFPALALRYTEKAERELPFLSQGPQRAADLLRLLRLQADLFAEQKRWPRALQALSAIEPAVFSAEDIEKHIRYTKQWDQQRHELVDADLIGQRQRCLDSIHEIEIRLFKDLRESKQISEKVKNRVTEVIIKLRNMLDQGMVRFTRECVDKVNGYVRKEGPYFPFASSLETMKKQWREKRLLPIATISKKACQDSLTLDPKKEFELVRTELLEAKLAQKASAGALQLTARFQVGKPLFEQITGLSAHLRPIHDLFVNKKPGDVITLPVPDETPSKFSLWEKVKQAKDQHLSGLREGLWTALQKVDWISAPIVAPKNDGIVLLEAFDSNKLPDELTKEPQYQTLIPLLQSKHPRDTLEKDELDPRCKNFWKKIRNILLEKKLAEKLDAKPANKIDSKKQQVIKVAYQDGQKLPTELFNYFVQHPQLKELFLKKKPGETLFLTDVVRSLDIQEDSFEDLLLKILLEKKWIKPIYSEKPDTKAHSVSREVIGYEIESDYAECDELPAEWEPYVVWIKEKLKALQIGHEQNIQGGWLIPPGFPEKPNSKDSDSTGLMRVTKVLLNHQPFAYYNPANQDISVDGKPRWERGWLDTLIAIGNDSKHIRLTPQGNQENLAHRQGLIRARRLQVLIEYVESQGAMYSWTLVPLLFDVNPLEQRLELAHRVYNQLREDKHIGMAKGGKEEGQESSQGLVVPNPQETVGFINTIRERKEEAAQQQAWLQYSAAIEPSLTKFSELQPHHRQAIVNSLLRRAMQHAHLAFIPDRELNLEQLLHYSLEGVYEILTTFGKSRQLQKQLQPLERESKAVKESKGHAVSGMPLEVKHTASTLAPPLLTTVLDTYHSWETLLRHQNRHEAIAYAQAVLQHNSNLPDWLQSIFQQRISWLAGGTLNTQARANSLAARSSHYEKSGLREWALSRHQKLHSVTVPTDEKVQSSYQATQKRLEATHQDWQKQTDSDLRSQLQHLQESVFTLREKCWLAAQPSASEFARSEVENHIAELVIKIHHLFDQGITRWINHKLHLPQGQSLAQHKFPARGSQDSLTDWAIKSGVVPSMTKHEEKITKQEIEKQKIEQARKDIEKRYVGSAVWQALTACQSFSASGCIKNPLEPENTPIPWLEVIVSLSLLSKHAHLPSMDWSQLTPDLPITQFEPHCQIRYQASRLFENSFVPMLSKEDSATLYHQVMKNNHYFQGKSGKEEFVEEICLALVQAESKGETPVKINELRRAFHKKLVEDFPVLGKLSSDKLVAVSEIFESLAALKVNGSARSQKVVPLFVILDTAIKHCDHILASIFADLPAEKNEMELQLRRLLATSMSLTVGASTAVSKPEHKPGSKPETKSESKPESKQTGMVFGAELHVPDDHSCLFWSVALGVLIPVLNNNAAYRAAFNRLFVNPGDVQDAQLFDRLQANLKARIEAFLVTNDTHILERKSDDDPLYRLINHYFRQKVASYIASHPQTYTDELLGRDNRAYVDALRSPTFWGGQIEIHAMFRLLGENYQLEVVGGNFLAPGKPVINLIFTNAKSGSSGVKNHYNVRMPVIVPIAEQVRDAKASATTGVTSFFGGTQLPKDPGIGSAPALTI